MVDAQPQTIASGADAARPADRALALPVRAHGSELRLALAAMARDRLALGGLLVLALAILIALLAPWISPYDPTVGSATAPRLSPPLTPGHLLGTDEQGRDLLSRIIWGGRVSIPIAVAPIIVSSLAGVALGLTASFAGGLVAGLIMRSLDVIFAFPGVLLAVAVAAILGPGMMNVMLAMSIVLLPYVTRIVYVETTILLQMDFIEAARVSGTRPLRLMFREVLPNVVGPVIVFATTSLGGMLVLAAGLSFLGVGVQPPTPDWGIMASDGRVVLATAPWVSILPGLVVVIVAVACNLAGDGLRDALDPRQRTLR
jgi:ABC-type dipeptide/oligopeptide/nickel transport system permease subunit